MSTAPKRPLDVLLVEDDDEFVADLRDVVASRLTLRHAPTARDSAACVDRPDAAVVDLGLPDRDGVEVIDDLARRFPDLPIVVLTNAHEPARVIAAIRAGACGYLFKEDADRLPDAVEEARSGGAPMSREVARWVLEWARQGKTLESKSASSLTEREQELVRLLGDGCSYAQAAAAMNVSLNTVRTHVRNVYDKLSVGNRTEAVMAAMRLGVLRRQA